MPPDAALAQRARDTGAPESNRARRIRAVLARPAGPRSACGLTHRFTCRSWPSLAGLIWWMLRDRNAPPG